MEHILEYFKLRITGIIDVHVHLGLSPGFDRKVLKTAKWLGVEKVCAFPYRVLQLKDPKEIWEANEYIYSLQEKYEEVIGFVFVNPFTVDSEKLINEFVGKRGMKGIKVYRIRARSSLLNPVAELAIQYDVPVLIHTAHRLYPRDRPNESTPIDIKVLARKFPKLRIIMAHLGGGGDWEFALETIKDVSNVYVDIGGTVVDNGLIEMAIEYLGEDRVVFGSDNGFTIALGKVEAAEIDEEAKWRICVDNPKKVVGID